MIKQLCLVLVVTASCDVGGTLEIGLLSDGNACALSETVKSETRWVYIGNTVLLNMSMKSKELGFLVAKEKIISW